MRCQAGTKTVELDCHWHIRCAEIFCDPPARGGVSLILFTTAAKRYLEGTVAWNSVHVRMHGFLAYLCGAAGCTSVPINYVLRCADRITSGDGTRYPWRLENNCEFAADVGWRAHVGIAQETGEPVDLYVAFSGLQ